MTEKLPLWRGYVVSFVGFVSGIIYYVWLAYDHQGFGPNAELLVLVGAIVFLPITIGVLAPAWVLFPIITCESRRTRRRLLIGAASALPSAVIAFGIVVQGSDWDELLLFIIPFGPTVAVLAVMSFTKLRD